MGGALAGLGRLFTRKKAAVARKAVLARPHFLDRCDMDWKTASRLFFAATLIAIGIIGAASGGFAPIWQPVPETTPARQLLAYLCTLVSLACGAGLMTKRTAAPAALVLLLYLLVWTVAFKVPFIVRAPLEEVSYQSTGENVVLIAAAWALYAEFPRRRNLMTGDAGLRIACFLNGLALIAFGFSHFVYLQMTAPLVPGWLPGAMFWAYLTGGIYVLTGAALVIGMAVRLAATAAAVQITLITVLVWGPIVLAGNLSATHWQEALVSWALTAGAWVVAGALQDRNWVDLPLRRHGARAETA
jgi:uncharacterized membrane protein